MKKSSGKRQASVAADLLEWYDQVKRDLPWRRTREAYRIWISEIMLQQTRVAAVIPYYDRFLERFPNVHSLAEAPEADLLARWAGLGYYSRARNLQKAAKRIVEAGEFPREYEAIRALPGIGDYTAAAISSIAFDLPHAVLDGNVARVLSRLMAERGNIKSTNTKRALRQHAQRLLDPLRPGEFNQAIMELGATVCLPRDPQCLLCPVSGACEARRLGIQAELPLNQIRRETVFLDRTLWVVVHQGPRGSHQHRRVLLALAEDGFWELPAPFSGAREVREAGGFRHSITHHIYRFDVAEAKLLKAKPRAMRWHSLDALDEIPLRTTAKKGIRCWKKAEAGAAS